MAHAASWGRSPLLAASVGVYSGIGSWIGLPVTAGLDLGDKFGTIGATAMTPRPLAYNSSRRAAS